MSMTTVDNGPDTREPGRPELAPSDVRAAAPVLSQTAGVVGLALAVAGAVAVTASALGRATFVGEGYGTLMGVVGLVLMFVHALRDTETEVRRLYGGLAATFLVAAVVVSLAPNKAGRVGEYLLPYGATLGFLSLAFFVPFRRNESEPGFRRVVEAVLLWTGASLAVSAVVAGVLVPDFLVGPGIALALLGVGFLALYLSGADASVGVGRQVAVGLGVLGVVTVAVAVGRSVVPTVLYDGPAAIRTPAQTIDTGKALGRGLAVLAALGVAAVGFLRPAPVWLRTMAAVFGLALAGALVAGAASKLIVDPPAPFLVPYGLILLALGLLYAGVSVGVASESHFVVLARRELAAYFYSPSGYLILFGMAAVLWLGYGWFVLDLASLSDRGLLPDPIVKEYRNFGIIGAFVTVFLVPAVTMGLFAEERRTGTYEVLLTAPVAEGTVVLAKFFAAWLFFLVAWLPAGLYLVALRVSGGAGFDYLPVLTFYMALAATVAAFVAVGTFFSSLTRDQIVAAVLTFAVLMGFLLTIIIGNNARLPAALQVVLLQFDFLTLWQGASQGQLSVQAVTVQASVAVFFLFLTTKVLEARKWS